MTEQTNPAIAQKTRIWPMYRAVVGVGIACALVIVMVYETTKPIIERQSGQLRRQAVEDVLPGSVDSRPFRLLENGEFEPFDGSGEGSRQLVFAAYDEDGELVGLAIAAEAMGYQDVIELIYGYSPAAQSITGIKVLKSRETPGLGDRIETDPQFLRNFDHLDVGLNSTGDSLANPIQFVKTGEKQAAWQIDGISGATISSAAVANMLADSTERWIPQIVRRKQDFVTDRKDQ